MGYRKDQSFPGETVRPLSPDVLLGDHGPRPPPLPPRRSSRLSPYSTPRLPPITDEGLPGYHSRPLDWSWAAQDPRATSTESLVPRERDERRTLLLIYIHGFMGNETSFQSFPAHVHNLATSILVETHVVHTKVYPRYRSRKAIEFARDAFSNWLQPHESPKTDIILLGHSMGGLISAEVVLKPPSPPSEEPLRHHILGTISFDTPFLGMHPGVIVSGISSLFKPPPPMNTKPHAVAAAENKSLHSLVPSPLLMPTGRDKSKLPGREAIPSERREVPDSSDSGYFNQEPVALDYTSHMLATEASISQLSLATPGEGEAANDPNFNPPFENDVRLSNRKGWANFFHFVSKHSDNLFKVTKEYVGSHMEFGSAMADYEGLKSRYLKIRALEDIDDFAPLSPSESGNPQKKLRRVRFVNYYTASTGRLQPPKSKFSMGNIEPRPAFDGASSSVEEGVENMSLSTDSSRISFSVQSEEGGAKPLDVVKETGESSGSSDDEFCEIGPSQFDGIRESSPDMKELEPTPELDPETTPASDHEDIAGQQNEDGNAEVEEAAVPTDPPTIEEDGSKSGDIPAMPTRPEPFDASLYSDEVNRKAAEKEYTRQTKVFEKALKERNNAIKEQAKLKEKREKSARQAREKQVKQEEKIRVKEEKEEMKKQAKQEKKEMKAKVPKNADPASIAMATAAATSAHVDPTKHPDGVMPEGDKSDEHQEKHKRDRRFCVIPHRNADGKRPCWERVYMVGVDEVGAHCGLFFADRPHYEHLISDVGERIKDWVQHAASVREIGKLQSDGPLDVD